jgi:hypothetical protein
MKLSFFVSFVSFVAIPRRNGSGPGDLVSLNHERNEETATHSLYNILGPRLQSGT